MNYKNITLSLILASGMIYSSSAALIDGPYKTEICQNQKEVVYRNIAEIQPGQVRFSSKNVELKVQEALKKGDVWIDEKGCYQFKYQNGQSPFPEKETLPLIKAPFGYVLADGHHHTLAGLSLGACSVPTKILTDLSSLSEEQFWEVAEQNGWVYFYDLEGHKMEPPKDFLNLIDDPNRYFAAITARKCREDGNLKESIGSEYPLWIKIGKDIPFIEFKISDALRQAGLCYTYEMGDEPSIEFVEAAREALVKAQIPGLKVVPVRKHIFELTDEKD